jgi:organic radical activating enzyme
MVSIVIPSIRPDKLERCLKAIKENANYPNYEVIVEKDDPENPRGAPKVLKRGVEKSTGDLVMFLGDDTIPQKDFLLNAVNAMGKRFTSMDGLVALNDMINKGEVCSHWLASKQLLDYLGGEFFYTGYDHLFCDDELMARTKKIGKFHWEENAKVQHDHPVVHGWSEETYDKHYRRVFSNEAIAKGWALLEARSKELEFEIPTRDTPKTLPWRDGRVINRIALPVTRACNRNCPECSARMADPSWDRKNPHVSIDELRWVGKTLGAIKTVEMTGGEPSLHPDFVEISEHIHDWFECKDIMLLTNGYLFEDDGKLPLLLNYDRVYVSWYTNNFAIKYHTDANTGVVNKIEDYLKKNGQNVWIQRMDSHFPIGKPLYKGIPTCGYDKGDSVGYGAGRIYGCCTAYWLPFHGKSIPLTPDWREHLGEIGLPCPSCFLTGEAK